MTNFANPLEAASYYAQLLVTDLKSANTDASAVEHLLILPMIQDAVKLTNQIDALLFALNSKE